MIMIVSEGKRAQGNGVDGRRGTGKARQQVAECRICIALRKDIDTYNMTGMSMSALRECRVLSV